MTIDLKKRSRTLRGRGLGMLSFKFEIYPTQKMCKLIISTIILKRQFHGHMHCPI